jgi:pimeloyl-ACP methyl ester carboxylesterase
MNACFAHPELIPAQRMAEAVEEVRRRYDAPWYVDAYLRTLRGLVSSFLLSYVPGPNSMWRMAARITAPTLVITGRQDKLVDVRVAPAVGKLIVDSRLLVLDQVGHVAQMERPDMVARAAVAMLNEVALEPALAVDDANSPVRSGDLSDRPFITGSEVPAAPAPDTLTATG